jgi:hypothetical protein
MARSEHGIAHDRALGDLQQEFGRRDAMSFKAAQHFITELRIENVGRRQIDGDINVESERAPQLGDQGEPASMLLVTRPAR